MTTAAEVGRVKYSTRRVEKERGGGRKRSAHNLPGYVNRELFKLIKLFIVLAMMHVIVHKETFHTLTC